MKTIWDGVTRYMWWEGGSHFGTSKPGTEVFATHENGTAAAVLVPAGAGEAAGIGPHGEADASWYSSRAKSTDTDGYDYDLVLKVVNRLVEK